MASGLENFSNVSKENDKLIETLDNLEKQVEGLRGNAISIEKEQDSIISKVNTILKNPDLQLITKEQKEEVQIIAHRLLERTTSVKVCVGIPRNPVQEASLQVVNQYIEGLEAIIKTDVFQAKHNCQSYLNACLPQHRTPIDYKFQMYIIDCTADDQKKIRKKLEELLNSMSNIEINNHLQQS